MSLSPVSQPISPQPASNSAATAGVGTIGVPGNQATAPATPPPPGGIIIQAPPPQNRWEGFESFGKRFGWIISSLSFIVSTIGVLIAGTNLSNTIEKNGRDLRSSIEAQRQSTIAQALTTLQNPTAPGVRHSLEIIAREGIAVEGIHLEGAYLERAKLPRLKADNASFEHAKMNAVDLSDAEIGNSSFAGSEMSGSNLRAIGRSPAATKVIDAYIAPVAKQDRDPGRAIITNDYYRMNFTNSILNGAALDRAFIPGALFRGANLRDATFIGSNVAGADFTDADTTNADFSGADLGSGPSATRITQKQIDAACAAAGQKPSVPNGMRPPSRSCR
jgi:uncharacterized protein YjbI with pentapeptide repeats